MEIKLNLSAGDSRHRSRDVSYQQRINWFPERQNYEGATEEWSLVQIEGSAEWLDVGGASRCRGLKKAGNGSLYGVWGANVYEVKDYLGTPTAYLRGTVASANSPVWMVDNGVHMVITDGNQMYLHELGSSNGITSPSYPFTAPSHVDYIGGYVVCIRNSGSLLERGRFYYSDLLDATSWPALNYFTAEDFSDPLVSLVVRDGEIWLFGSSTYEVWGLTGDANRPFTRIGGSARKIGISGRYSAAVIGGSILWVGSSKAGADGVYMANGYEAQQISDVTISQFLSGAAVADVIAWTYQGNGHTFYVLQFTTEDTTLVYDLTTGKWHRRESQKQDNTFGRWNHCYAEYAFGKTLVGFGTAGVIAYLDADEFTEADDSPIVRTFVSNGTIANGHPIMCRELVAYFDAGQITDPSTTPYAMLRVSRDGGYTWSSSRWRDFGGTGQYGRSCKWTQLGIAREFTFEIVVSANCRSTLVGAYADFERGVGR
jgi:hypothetical protein